MIEQRTVLILGAGASKTYGFPSGDELLSSIKDVLLNPVKGDNKIGLLKDIGFKEDHIHDFRRELELSPAYSVDAFLEHRPEFLDLGKLTITLSLIPCENEDNLFIRGRKRSHYRYLFNIMQTDADFDRFDQNRLSFITFNYDRSLEHFLFTALKRTYDRTDFECAEKIKAIPIVHVHGSLGALPCQSSTGRSYSPNYTHDVLKAAAAQIVVVSEDIGTSPEFDEAFGLLEDAKKVYFLGFGYNDVNLKRLKLNMVPVDLRRDPRGGSGIGRLTNMMGSSYGLEMAEKRAIMKKWMISLPDVGGDCLLFLRRCVEFE